MPKHRILHHLVAPGIFCAALAAGCQAPVSGLVSSASLKLAAPAASIGAGSVQVRFLGNFAPLRARLAQRKVLATVADIDHIVVTVHVAGYASQSQTIGWQAIANGAAASEITNVPVGTATVSVTIYNASGNVIGASSQTTTVTNGAHSTVSFNVTLDPTYVYPSGTVDTNVQITDGATITLGATATASPTSSTLSLTSLPAKASVGSDITIAGTGFDAANLASDTVTINGVPATIVSASSSSLKVVVPAGATSGPVVVTSDAQSVASATNLTIVPSGTVIGTFPAGDSPWVLAIDPQGAIWVTSNNSNTVSKLSPAGVLLGTYATGLSPDQIGFTSDNHVWVSDANANKVQEFDQTGTALTQLQVLSSSVPPNGMGVAVDASDTVWVAASDTVQRISSAGTLLSSLSVPNLGPAWVAIDRQGNAWIANTLGGELDKVASDGQTVLGRYHAGSPSNLAIDTAGDVWVGGYGGSSLMEFAPDGAQIGNFTAVQEPGYLAFGNDGDLWVSSWQGTVTKLSPSGAVLATYPVGGSPEGIAVDADGNVWVANTSSGTVTELAP